MNASTCIHAKRVVMPDAARTLPDTSDDRLPLSVLPTFSSPYLVLGAMDLAVFVSLPHYFAGHLGIGTALIGGVWWSARLVDILVDVLLAVMMDRTRTRIGRYRAWLPAGAPILMLGIYKLFMAPPG
jgi:GPH family glycoside/pentoside/hexuronide:cation symporter